MIKRILIAGMMIMSSKCLGIKPEDMLPNTWYDVVELGQKINQVVCDSSHQNRMYGLCSGVYLSDDSGRTWRKSMNGIGDLVSVLQEKLHINESDSKIGCVYYYVLSTEEGHHIGRLFKSTDMGESWTIQCEVENVWGDFAFHPYEPIMITEIRVNETSTIIKSTDEGVTWIDRFHISEYSRIYDFCFAPLSPSIVYAGSGYDGKEIMKSTDTGDTWASVGNGTEWGTFVQKVVVHPNNTNTVFAVLDDTFPYRYSMKISTNAGNTWQDFGPESIGDRQQEFEFYIHPSDPNIMLLLSRDCQSVIRSSNGGQTWEAVVWEKGDLLTSSYDRIAASPWESSDIFLSTDALIRSEDYGLTWSATCPTKHTYNSGLWIDPSIPDKILYYCENSGIFISGNGGLTWESSKANDNFGFTTTHVFQYSANPLILFDIEGSRCDPIFNNTSRSRYSVDGGFTWTDINSPPEGRLVFARPSQNDPHRVFAIVSIPSTETERTLNKRLYISNDLGNNWHPVTAPGSTNIADFSDVYDNPHMWLVVSSEIPSGMGELFVSLDYGISWEKRGQENGFSGLLNTACYNYEAAEGEIVLDRHNKQRIYIDLGQVYCSEDLGMNWEQITRFDHQQSYKGSFVVDPINSEVLYYRMGHPYQSRRSVDRGKSWSNAEFPTRCMVSSDGKMLYDLGNLKKMRIDSKSSHLLVAGFPIANGNTSNITTIAALCSDQDINDYPIGVELCLGADPIGYSFSNEFPERTGFFYSDPLIIPPGVYFIELRAKDRFGCLSDPWPLLRTKL